MGKSKGEITERKNKRSSTNNGIMWILASGAAWRFLPPKYGKWNSVYKKFRQWSSAGVFDSLLKNKSEETEILAIDSTFCKFHQHAAGARKILGHQDIGRWQNYQNSLSRK